MITKFLKTLFVIVSIALWAVVFYFALLFGHAYENKVRCENGFMEVCSGWHKVICIKTECETKNDN